jgi:hypothetical protein
MEITESFLVELVFFAGEKTKNYTHNYCYVEE